MQEQSKQEVADMLSKIHYLKNERDKLEFENLELKDKLKHLIKPSDGKLHPARILLQKVMKKRKSQVIQSMSLATVEREIDQI